MYSLFIDIFWVIVLLNIAALVVWVIFLFNARINLKRQIEYKRFLIRLIQAALKLDSSEEAAAALHISVAEFKEQCRRKNVDIPEVRKEKDVAIENRKKAEELRIIQEEANWRSEQERLMDERRKTLEDETNRRMERLKKFGFR